jgi:hypothetical protein
MPLSDKVYTQDLLTLNQLGLHSSCLECHQRGHLKGHFFGLWSNHVARGTGFLQFGLTIRHF